ncbi:MAG: DUF3822 family protein [Leadbetterella sp.]|nr:DUF3822 family protein [Leadbetterella sp.]
MNTCFKITDDRFSAERTDLYDLILEIQFTRLRFIVRSGDQLLWLEDHFLGNSNDITACEKAVSSLIREHAFLGGRFWKSVKLISDFQVHTLVPSAHFEASRAPGYLALTFPTADPDKLEVISETVGSQALVAGTVKSVNILFRTFYPNLTVSSALAVGLRYFNNLNGGQTMGVISETFLDLYYQNLKTKTIAVIKSPLKNLDHLIAGTSDLLLYGEVTPYSRTYGILETRFRNLILGDNPLPEALPGKFSGLPPQRYFTLLASCVRPIPA